MNRVKNKIKTTVDHSIQSLKNLSRPTEPFYVISHERSGTHFLINTINQNLPVRVGKGFGKGSDYGWNNIGEWFGPYDQPAARYDHINSYNELFWGKGAKRNSIIKTHSSRKLFESKFRKAPVLYVYRDPRDVMVSWFHYLNNPGFYSHNPQVEDISEKDFSVFLRRPCNDFLSLGYDDQPNFNNVIERWASHTADWLSAPDICVIRFEELKSHPELALSKVCTYLGIEQEAETNEVDLQSKHSILPRKGVVGDWANYCTDADLALIKECTEKYGLDWESLTTH